MNKADINDIQKALNWIRQQVEDADSAAKIEVLALLNGTSQSVISMAKKLTEPKVNEMLKRRWFNGIAKEMGGV